MVTQQALRDIAAKVFACSPFAIRVEVGVEEVDGAAVHFAEAYTSPRAGRVLRGQRSAERIARVPYVGSQYERGGAIPYGENAAFEALAELLTAELAAKGAA